MHTERLEDEKKHYTNHISNLEHELDSLRIQISELQIEKQGFNQYVDTMNMEKEEMIRQHTIETADLRKKISVLSNHVQVLEGSVAPTNSMASHVSGYTGAGTSASTMGPFGDMESLTMDGATDSWEHLFPGMPNVGQPQQPEQQVIEIKADPEPTKTNNDAQAVNSVLASTEKSGTQGGLLFMLFLVGAFVMSSRQMPSIPHVSDEMRVASAELLENVLKDAGENAPNVGSAVAPAVIASSSVSANIAAPAPSVSASAWAQPATVEPSMLGQLSDQLMQPTDEQANEQIFSLNAEQYSGVVSSFPDTAAAAPSSAPTNQGRRNLADALASMRSNSKAEVYTRSLLWDQIPTDVVRSFVKMVSEVNTASPRADGQQ